MEMISNYTIHENDTMQTINIRCGDLIKESGEKCSYRDCVNRDLGLTKWRVTWPLGIGTVNESPHEARCWL